MATYLIDSEEKEINTAIKIYIKTLYEAKAVDDDKMKRYYYDPIEKLVKLWKPK